MADVGRERYEAICEAAPDAILLVGADGTINFANDRVTDVFGYEPEEIVDEPVERLVPEADRDDHVALRDGYLAEPTTRPMGADVDLAARRKDGSTVPVDISLSPLGGDGPLEVMAVVRDVSDQHALREKYRTILESVPDAVVIADAADGRIVEANEEVRSLWGYDPDDLVGEPQSSLHPTGERDRYEGLFDEHAAAGSAIFTQLPDGSDIYVETAAGEHIPVEINASTLEIGDEELLVGVFRDIRTRKERERQLKELNETTQRLMAAEDREAVAQLVADAANSILGYGSTVVRFLTDGERLAPVAVSEQARSEMGDRPDYPLAEDTPASNAYQAGEPRYVEDVQTFDDEYDRGEARSGMYLPMGEHGVLSVVDARVDAFDQADVEFGSILAANAETALDRVAYERELERQNARLDQFASVVSHDLRNPLQVAQGWLDTVDASDESLDRVENALDRMEEIVMGTLTLAQQGATVSEQEPIDVRTLGRNCWRMVSTGQATIEFADEFRPLGDRERLQHVFENLFRNAIDHGGEEVTVTVGRLEGGFYVEDDGPGLPEGERDELFEPGHTNATDGTGFGLSIVREIAEAHGWAVSATEGADGGARFEFTGVEFA